MRDRAGKVMVEWEMEWPCDFGRIFSRQPLLNVLWTLALAKSQHKIIIYGTHA